MHRFTPKFKLFKEITQKFKIFNTKFYNGFMWLYLKTDHLMFYKYP